MNKRSHYLTKCLILNKHGLLEGPFKVRIENGIVASLEKVKDIGVIEGKKPWGDYPILLPSIIDVHVHFRVPGKIESGFEVSQSSMAKGGITGALGMGNTNPAIDNIDIWSGLRNRLNGSNLDIDHVATISRGLKGEELTDIEGLSAAGVRAFSDDGKPLTDELFREALKRLRQYEKPILLHEEDFNKTGNGVMTDGETSRALGLVSIKRDFESSKIKRDLEVIKKEKGRVHFQHISTKSSVEALRRARQEGLSFTCETCPHYLLLTDKYVNQNGKPDPNKKMKPPLGTDEDMQALRDAVKEGLIDIIASDHAPHKREDKEKGFIQAPFGVIGLETLLSASLEALYFEEEMLLTEIMKLFTINPTRLLDIDKLGYINEGQVADCVLIDLNSPWVVREEDILTGAKNSPFQGRRFRARVIETYSKGIKVYG